jgi:hypothetical protein
MGTVKYRTYSAKLNPHARPSPFFDDRAHVL